MYDPGTSNTVSQDDKCHYCTSNDVPDIPQDGANVPGQVHRDRKKYAVLEIAESTDVKRIIDVLNKTFPQVKLYVTSEEASSCSLSGNATHDATHDATHGAINDATDNVSVSSRLALDGGLATDTSTAVYTGQPFHTNPPSNQIDRTTCSASFSEATSLNHPFSISRITNDLLNQRECTGNVTLNSVLTAGKIKHHLAKRYREEMRSLPRLSDIKATSVDATSKRDGVRLRSIDNSLSLDTGKSLYAQNFPDPLNREPYSHPQRAKLRRVPNVFELDGHYHLDGSTKKVGSQLWSFKTTTTMNNHQTNNRNNDVEGQPRLFLDSIQGSFDDNSIFGNIQLNSKRIYSIFPHQRASEMLMQLRQSPQQNEHTFPRESVSFPHLSNMIRGFSDGDFSNMPSEEGKPQSRSCKNVSKVSKRETTNETRTFSCMFCQRQFTRNDMLNRHLRLHSGVKPYQCTVCGQTFSRSDHLSTHQRTHTGEKPHKCPQCPYVACRRDMITRHLRIHNKTNSEESTQSTESHQSPGNTTS